MQIKEGHWYELDNGEIGKAERDSNPNYPWRICDVVVTREGYFRTDWRESPFNVKREVLVTDAPVPPWWEREGIVVGDLVRTHNRRLWQVADIDDHGVLIYFADSNTISWPLLEKDFQCKVEMKEVPRAH